MIGDRVLAMLRKEFRSVFRDPRMRLVIFGVPIIQTLIFGYAVTMDVRHVQLVVVDRDQTPASRELVARFTSSNTFTAVLHTTDERAAEREIDAGRAAAILQLNAGFAAAVAAHQPAEVLLAVDGSDSNTARLVLGYAQAIATSLATEQRLASSQREREPPPPTGGVELHRRAWFNPDLESRNYFVPGVMAVLVMLIGLMLTGMAIVREKEAGTIEQIMVTPIRPMEFILGKFAPFILIGFVDVVLVTLVGVYWFGIPIRGSFVLLLVGTGCFLLSTLGIGLFISTVSQTQQQAMMTTFFFFFPAMLLSGFIYPIANMPPVVQALTLLDPLRYYLVIIRGVFLKGVGWDILWPQLLALVALGLVVLGVAASRFRKTTS